MIKRILLPVLGLLLVLTIYAAGALATVQVKETVVRDQPSFTGKTTGILKYGARVSILEENAGWARVSADGEKIQGWIHGSSITKKAVSLSSKGGAGTSASSSEVSLAGKGFNQQVESQYRSQNALLDFDSIDEMERIRVQPEEASRFLSEGDLLPKGGI